MFRIRRIYDDILPVNREAIRTVQGILAGQFPAIGAEEAAALPERLTNPAKHGFRAILYVAEKGNTGVRGFALCYHEPDLPFLYLDFLASPLGRTSRGVGGALYARVRRDARELGCVGVFFECLPDDPALSPNPETRRQNVARLRFYERFGARPIAGTRYETPVKPGTTDPPYLVFDDLGSGVPLKRDHARQVVRAILERKYRGVCPPDYVQMVVDSFQGDPVRLRPPRFGERVTVEPPSPTEVPTDHRIALTVTDNHAIHHVHEQGYVESPVRISAIVRELRKTVLFDERPPRRYSERHVTALHDPGWVSYFRRVCERVGPEHSVYPYVFPLRNAARPPRELEVRAGYYCMDTFTPLTGNAYPAARRAVDCALTAAEAILDGTRLAYALVRPPGHHAEQRVFGGFCYFNNTAIAAHFLSLHARVAILDLDYHHGNGQQQIFYERSDILTVSIHGHPNFAFPYFSGFADERGSGNGHGFNLNLPLPEEVDGGAYRAALGRALDRVARFRPQVLVVALGLDTVRNDPTGTWSLTAADLHANGRLVGGLGCPVLVVQEGGYRVRNLGSNARSFLSGLWSGAFGRTAPRPNHSARGSAGERIPLEVEEPALAPQAAAIAGEGAVGAHHPVARHHHRDPVVAVGPGHRPHRARLAEEAGLVGVAPRLAVRDRPQHLPDPLLERGAAQVERDLEPLELAREVAVELPP